MPNLTDISVVILALSAVLGALNHHRLQRRVEALENK